MFTSITPSYCLSDIIDDPGSYKTRSGDIVQIKKVTNRGFFNCYGNYKDGTQEQWTKSGRIFKYRETQNDIIFKIKIENV